MLRLTRMILNSEIIKGSMQMMLVHQLFWSPGRTDSANIKLRDPYLAVHLVLYKRFLILWWDIIVIFTICKRLELSTILRNTINPKPLYLILMFLMKWKILFFLLWLESNHSHIKLFKKLLLLFPLLLYNLFPL